jgi:chromosome segregation ATPase
LQEQLHTLKAEVEQLLAAIRDFAAEADRLEYGVADRERVIAQIEFDVSALKAELIELKPKITRLKGTLDTLQKKRTALACHHHAKQHIQYKTFTALASLRDESKSIREKQSRRAKYHEEIRRVNAVGVARIEADAQQLNQLELDIMARKQENDRVERQLAETEQA